MKSLGEKKKLITNEDSIRGWKNKYYKISKKNGICESLPIISTFDLQKSEILSERHRAAQWIKKQKEKDPTICFLQETALACKYECRLRIRSSERNPHNWKHRKKWDAVLLSDSRDFKPQLTQMTKEAIIEGFSSSRGDCAVVHALISEAPT